MGLSDVAGVFSRYFVVGFFVPAFFSLLAVGYSVDESFLPAIYNESSRGAQIAILGGAALLLGLLLTGVSRSVARLYEGYPLRSHGPRWPTKWLYTRMFDYQRSRYKRREARTKSDRGTAGTRFDARWRLDRQFPSDEPELLMPTKFGNASRASDRYSFRRWHLNTTAIWPHVENVLSAQEAQVLAEARGDQAFFLNFSLLAALSFPILLADRFANDSALSALLGLIPLAISYVAYRCATSASERLGDVVGASIDLHRREVYTKLGIRAPKSFTDELWIAWNLNNTLLVGMHMPDEYADPPAAPARQGASANGGAKKNAASAYGGSKKQRVSPGAGKSTKGKAGRAS